jgi:hypothetical protein
MLSDHPIDPNLLALDLVVSASTTGTADEQTQVLGIDQCVGAPR